jgi:UDP-arabinose 4-epimerase
LKWVALRYFNAAGADPEGEAGENHDPETHLIPLAIQAAAGNGPPLQIFGTDYPTPDGTAIRDYIHVSDLADAHVRALAYLRRGGESSAFNLGTGHGFSVREIADAIARVMCCEVPLIESPRREGDPPTLVADTRRANTMLGWRPQHSGLDNIVRTALAWERSKTFALAAE